jgi:hypothetical protein
VTSDTHGSSRKLGRAALPLLTGQLVLHFALVGPSTVDMEVGKEVRT